MARGKQIGFVPTKTSEWILLGVGVYLGYDKIIKPLLETLGVKKSQAQINVEAAASDPRGPWAGQNFIDAAPVGASVLLLTQANADAMASTIWNSVGWTYDDFEKCFSVFKKLKTQSQCAALVIKFQQKYKKDLATWLLGDAWPSDRFSADEVNQIMQYVSKLPKYKV